MNKAWQEWKKQNAERQKSGIVRPWDVINPDTQNASPEEADRRYAICEKCPQLTVTKQCKKCGCLMPLKTKLLYATCPIDKW